MALPSPMEIVDAAGDGLCELVKLPVRAVGNLAGVTTQYANSLLSTVDLVKTQTPQNFMCIPQAAINLGSHTINAGFDGINALGQSIEQTLAGLKQQVNRVIR